MAKMIHVLVPFHRYHLFETLKGIWGKTPDGVVFHPIIDDPEHPIESSDFIVPFYCGEVPAGWNRMYWKLNHFLDQIPVHDNDMYGFLCDDDAFEPGFYEKIFDYIFDHDVLICSMKRGKQDPGTGNGHPPTTLLACKEYMQVGKVGMEQLFIKGYLLKTLRFQNLSEADGHFIVNLVSKLPIKYVPDAFIWFNYLEPGRWLPLT